jgi:predicted lipoprotein
MERLLFDAGAEAALRKAGDDGVRRCQVLRAITRNVVAIAGEVQQEWTGGDAAYARRFTAPGPENTAYPEAKDATVAPGRLSRTRDPGSDKLGR